MALQIHFAEVTRNTDEELEEGLRGAVFFKSETFTGGVEFPLPAEPMFPYANAFAGFFMVPFPGDIIEIEIDTAIEHPRPRWRCMVYSTEDELAEEFQENYPYRMGWKTNAGHILLFDDFEGEELVRLRHSFGTGIDMDVFGNLIEEVLRNKETTIGANEVLDVRKKSNASYGSDRTIECLKNQFNTVRGNREDKIINDYTLDVGGLFTLKYNRISETVGGRTQMVGGGNTQMVDGGQKQVIGGSESVSVVSNSVKSIAGDHGLLVAGKSEETIGTGKKITIALGGYEIELVAGNFDVMILAGNIMLQTLAGSAELGNILGKVAVDPTGAAELSNLLGKVAVDTIGAIEVSNAIGSLKIAPTGQIDLMNALAMFSLDVAGNATLSGIMTKLGLGTSPILSVLTDPIVDTITGAPHIGIPTVLGG